MVLWSAFHLPAATTSVNVDRSRGDRVLGLTTGAGAIKAVERPRVSRPGAPPRGHKPDERCRRAPRANAAHAAFLRRTENRGRLQFRYCPPSRGSI